MTLSVPGLLRKKTRANPIVSRLFTVSHLLKSPLERLPLLMAPSPLHGHSSDGKSCVLAWGSDYAKVAAT
eukprot:3418250-Amphidinium_carterae.3